MPSVRNVLALTLVAAVAHGQSAKISPAVANPKAAHNGYFVVLNDPTPEQKVQLPEAGMARTRAAFDQLYARKASLEAFAREQSLGDVEIFWIANAIWVRAAAAPGQARALAQDARVRVIAANPTVRFETPLAEFSASKATLAVTPGQTLIGSPQLWAIGIRGAGVVLAGEDTGYAWQHPGLINSYRGWNGSTANHNYNWFDGVTTQITPTGTGGGACGLSAQAPCDDGSHGTHTMGTMVGDDGGNEQVGAAPAAKWIGCRNMDRGDGRPDSYLRCMQFMLAPTDLAGNNPDPMKSPDIVNNSWGCPPSELCNAAEFVLLNNAILSMQSAGIMFVAAAGNQGSGCSSITDPPAIFAATFTVGNTTLTDQMAGSSSRGPVTVDGSNRRKPDVSAPGSGIRSTIPPNGYASFSGTSMASPHTAGAAALLISAFPDLRRRPEQVQALLQASTVPVLGMTQVCGGIAAATLPNNVAGYGRINVYSAYQLRLSTAAMFANGFE